MTDQVIQATIWGFDHDDKGNVVAKVTLNTRNLDLPIPNQEWLDKGFQTGVDVTLTFDPKVEKRIG